MNESLHTYVCNKEKNPIGPQLGILEYPRRQIERGSEYSSL